jgi:serine/threonine protein kinase
MLFELMTGELPFAGDNYFDLIAAHDQQLPPVPSSIVPGLPRELDELVGAMLSKAPASRPRLPVIRTVLKRMAKQLAAKSLSLTSRDLFRLRVIDDIIPEPLGGAHRDHRQTANTLKAYLLRIRAASGQTRSPAGPGPAGRRSRAPRGDAVADRPARRRRLGLGVAIALILAGGSASPGT